jgi:hypothetical protein
MRPAGRQRRNERGQAIAELTVALIAICSVFVGIIFMLAVGQTNIDSLLTVRGVADANALGGLFSSPGYPISRWEEGGDGMMFTNDDEPVMFFVDEPALFKGELQNGEYNLVTAPDYVQENFARDLVDEWMFLAAANMACGSASVDPFEVMPIEDLRGAFRALIYRGDITVRNSVYMPICEPME